MTFEGRLCNIFDAKTRTVGWGLPCMWTCNFDNGPWKDPAVAGYIRKASWVVEIRDRPGERGWSKLYEPSLGEEVDDELAAALAEARSYMDGVGVDEAVGISNDFGI